MASTTIKVVPAHTRTGSNKASLFAILIDALVVDLRIDACQWLTAKNMRPARLDKITL